MPLKPIKYRFKAYVLTESSSGYILNKILHEGKKRKLPSLVEELINPFIEKKSHSFHE